jgi:hypothetical protein
MAGQALTAASYTLAKSPPSGRSTLITRAPRSASCRGNGGDRLFERDDRHARQREHGTGSHQRFR